MTRRRRGSRELPDYCSEFKDRHGKWRCRFRRKGQKTYYFKSTPWSDSFMREYQACLDKTAAPKIEPGADRMKAGTISDLISRYYRAPEYTGLAASTQATYRNQLERFRQVHGEKRVARLERKHIKAIIGAMHATPAAANSLLDRLKVLLSFAVEEEMRKDNPARGVKGFRVNSEGFHSWTDEEIVAFERRHPIGTKARLAMTLMLSTGQRKSDAVVMGWQHVTDGWISVRQLKTKARLEIPMHPELVEVLASLPRDNLTFLMTEYRKPFSAKGFGNWFRDRCDEAGLTHCSAHGLRKAAARRLAEAGCTNQQIKAITGHKTDKEVARYTEAAAQRTLAAQAMVALQGAKTGTKKANRSKKGSHHAS